MTVIANARRAAPTVSRATTFTVAGAAADAMASAAGTAAGISRAEFERFRDLLHRVTGIHLSDAKQTLLVGRLSKRLRELRLASFGDYFGYLNSGQDPDELQRMVDLMTTNETYFFREPGHFDFLRRLAREHPASQALRVWSAASSTGEEAYTTCMVLADERGIGGRWSVLGSDISHTVLQVARAGRYELQRTRGLPDEYLRKYCLKGVRSQEGSFVIDKRLRAHTEFIALNLMQPAPDIGPFELIFLRNVMIYFDQPTKRRVVEHLTQRLAPGGHLVVGHSETLSGLSETLRAVRPTIYRRST